MSASAVRGKRGVLTMKTNTVKETVFESVIRNYVRFGGVR
jgi:hypothetical protein